MSDANQRILILGRPGSGKTHLAKRLANEMSLQLIEGDKVFWDESQGSVERFRLRVIELTQKPSWILEGHATKVIDLIDSKITHLIHLEPSPATCLRRMVWREVSGYARSRNSEHMSKLIFNLKNWRDFASNQARIVQGLRLKSSTKIFSWADAADAFNVDVLR